jgi:hypothetical protein
MIAGALEVEAGGEVLILLPQRALFWPATSMLVVADIHFGKAASFRAQGIPVPRGTTTENLEMLTMLVADTGATNVLFLGRFPACPSCACGCHHGGAAQLAPRASDTDADAGARQS